MATQHLFVLAASFLLAAGSPAAVPLPPGAEELQGTWAMIALESDGAALPADAIKAAEIQLVVSGDKFTHKAKGKVASEATFRLDPKAKPKTIDTTDTKGTVELGIYKVEGDRLTVCTRTKAGGQRPTEFSTKANSGHALFTFKRQKS